MLRAWWEKLSRVQAGSAAGQVVFVAMIMAAATFLALLEALVLRSWAPIAAAGLGWVFVAVYAAVRGSVFHRAGTAVASLTLPSGSSTPSVAQHSNIEAMIARGEYRKAADAYLAVIAADPADLVACENLGRLAMRELRDYDLAIGAYREAERRVGEPKRQFGYALIVAGIYRDNLRDDGKTMVEYRKMLARFPDAPNAARLRAELQDLKARHFDNQAT